MKLLFSKHDLRQPGETSDLKCLAGAAFAAMKALNAQALWGAGAIVSVYGA